MVRDSQESCYRPPPRSDHHIPAGVGLFQVTRQFRFEVAYRYVHDYILAHCDYNCELLGVDASADAIRMRSAPPSCSTLNGGHNLLEVPASDRSANLHKHRWCLPARSFQTNAAKALSEFDSRAQFPVHPVTPSCPVPYEADEYRCSPYALANDAPDISCALAVRRHLQAAIVKSSSTFGLWAIKRKPWT